MHSFWQMWCQHPLIIQLSQILLHSLWQIALLGLMYLAALLVIRSPRWRYVTGMVTLFAMLFLPLMLWGIWQIPATSDPVPMVMSAQAVVSASPMLPPMDDLAQPVIKDKQTVVMPLWPLVSLVWMVGMAVMSLRLMLGWQSLQKIRRRADAASDDLLARVRQISLALGVRGQVAMKTSADIASPILVGILRPVVLIPASLMTGAAPDVLESMIAHELAHVRRHDPVFNLLQMCVETLLFYHPAVWMLSRYIRVQRELCTDDLAAQAVGSKLNYARALSAMDDMRDESAQLALAAARGPLVNRIRHLVAPRVEARSRWVSITAAVLLLCLPVMLVVVACGKYKTQTSQKAIASDETSMTDLSIPGEYVAPQPEDHLYVRVYDVRDIFILPESHNSVEQLERIQSLIEAHVTHGSGTISQFHGQLVISQTEHNHLRVMALLNLLHERYRVQAEMEFRVIVTSDPQLVDLSKESTRKKLQIFTDFDPEVSANGEQTIVLSTDSLKVPDGGKGWLLSERDTRTGVVSNIIRLGFEAKTSSDRQHVRAKFEIRARNPDIQTVDHEEYALLLTSSATLSGDKFVVIGGGPFLPELMRQQLKLPVEQYQMFIAARAKVHAGNKVGLSNMSKRSELGVSVSASGQPNGILPPGWAEYGKTGTENNRPRGVLQFSEYPGTAPSEKQSSALTHLGSDRPTSPDLSAALALSQDSVVVRVYDIRDLLPAYGQNTDLIRAQLIQLVRTTAEDWPPEESDISEVSGQLVVKQKMSVQEKILRLIKQLRDAGSVQIAAEARILFTQDEAWIRKYAIDKLDVEKNITLTDQQLKELMQSKNTAFLNAPKVVIFNGGNAKIEVGNFEDPKKKQKKPAVSISVAGAVNVHRTHVQMKTDIQLNFQNKNRELVSILDESFLRSYPVEQMTVACAKQITDDCRFTDKDMVPNGSWVVVVIRDRIIIQKEMTEEEMKASAGK